MFVVFICLLIWLRVAMLGFSVCLGYLTIRGHGLPVWDGWLHAGAGGSSHGFHRKCSLKIGEVSVCMYVRLFVVQMMKAVPLGE
jgi:hypothetical protein